ARAQKGHVADLDLRRRSLAMVLHAGHLEIELLPPRVEGRFNREHRINGLSGLVGLQLGLETHRPHRNFDPPRSVSHHTERSRNLRPLPAMPAVRTRFMSLTPVTACSRRNVSCFPHEIKARIHL